MVQKMKCVAETRFGLQFDIVLVKDILNPI